MTHQAIKVAAVEHPVITYRLNTLSPSSSDQVPAQSVSSCMKDNFDQTNANFPDLSSIQVVFLLLVLTVINLLNKRHLHARLISYLSHIHNGNQHQHPNNDDQVLCVVLI